MDVRTSLFQPFRTGMQWIHQSSLVAMDWSIRRVGWLWMESGNHGELSRENQWLRQQRLSLQDRVVQLNATIDHYKESESLLQVRMLHGDTSLVANVLSVSPEPFVQWYVIDKGSKDGVIVGNAVADAKGILGQIASVENHTSRVILITDTRTAIPVKNKRTGERSLAKGFERQRLILLNVPSEQDVSMGDTYVTSGMGEVYPVDYAVGEVNEVSRETGTGFADIRLKPHAEFNRTRMVLVHTKSSVVSNAG